MALPATTTTLIYEITYVAQYLGYLFFGPPPRLGNVTQLGICDIDALSEYHDVSHDKQLAQFEVIENEHGIVVVIILWQLRHEAQFPGQIQIERPVLTFLAVSDELRQSLLKVTLQHILHYLADYLPESRGVFFAGLLGAYAMPEQV